ncbi:peptidoglycan DD-metalloendopeptidase family protein [Deinococcus malanensis]|uniref:peptidoglycan DD-metalloendopeptidase family protein n=1 Tax=Deinococcus malanensis TaxID=1706855 RepID=UPI003628F02F
MTFYPMLDTPTTRYSVQPGTGFLDEGYLKATGSQHESVDFNAITGGDTDLGDPVYVVEGGTVRAAFWHKGIGGIVLIEHPDGSEAHYWHLRDIHVRKGSYLNAGDLIGQVGKGGRGQWYAHLHFGVRKKAGQLAADHWPSTHQRSGEVRRVHPGALPRAAGLAGSEKREKAHR